MPNLNQPCDEGVLRAAPDTESCEKKLEPWILATTIIGSSMVFIDGTVVNIALPILQTDLNTTIANAQWVVEAYTLFLAALMLAGGTLGDHFGRRRIFSLGVSLFALASIGCGLAPTVQWLILSRAVQGLGGALLVPNSLAIISGAFSREQRGQAIGTWAGFTAITTALGPVLGGWLVDNFTWRAVFFINVPLALAVLALAARYVPESRDEEAAGLDWLGAGLVTLGLGGIVYGLIESADLSFSHPVVLTALIGGIIALILFFGVETKSQSPMLPLRLFRSRTFSGANFLTLLLYGALSGTLFFFPFNLVQVQGYSPTMAGASLLPFTIIMFLLSRWAGGLVTRRSARLPLIVGPIITAAGLALFARPGIGGSYWQSFFPAVVVMGIGMGLSVAPLTTVVMGAVADRHVGLASGVNNSVSRTAGLLAIAALGVLAQSGFNSSLDQRLTNIDLPPQAQQALDKQRGKLAEAEVPPNLDDDAQQALEQAIDISFVAAFRRVMLVAAGLVLASAGIAALTINTQETNADDEST